MDKYTNRAALRISSSKKVRSLALTGILACQERGMTKEQSAKVGAQ